MKRGGMWRGGFRRRSLSYGGTRKCRFFATEAERKRTIGGAYSWWIEQGWAIDNPAKKVRTPDVVTPEPGILKVSEMEKLFRANEKVDPEVCGLLALGAFGGMRASAIERLSHGEIKLEEWAILTPAEETKKRRRNYIEGLPENLWQWLERTPAAAFKLTPRQIAKRREKAFQRADLLVTKAEARKTGAKPKAPPKNCLRHSFATYHVALPCLAVARHSEGGTATPATLPS